MTCIRVDGNEILLVFPVYDKGCAKVLYHLLHVRFKFVESSICVEEEKKSKSGTLQKSIPIEKSVKEDGHCWYLVLGNCRAFELPLSMLAASTKILSW